MKDSLYVIWVRLKPTVVVLSAILPLIVIVLSALLGTAATYQKAAISLLFFQIALLISLSFETQKLLSRSSSSAIMRTYGMSDNPIWPVLKDRHSEDINIVALNGGRIVRCLRDANVQMSRIRAIFPSDAAIESFYASVPVDDRREMLRCVGVGFREFNKICDVLTKEGMLASVEVKRTDFFPVKVLVATRGGNSLNGYYYRSSDRDATTGLKAVTWLENRSDIIESEKTYFERIWKSASN